MRTHTTHEDANKLLFLNRTRDTALQVTLVEHDVAWLSRRRGQSMSRSYVGSGMKLLGASAAGELGAGGILAEPAELNADRVCHPDTARHLCSILGKECNACRNANIYQVKKPCPLAK